MILCLLSSIFLSLYLHHKYCLYQEARSLENYINVINYRTKQAVFQMRRSVAQVQNSVDICSTKDLNQLRKLVLHYPYIEDLGRITPDNKLICSALWGQFTPPIQLPDPMIHNGILTQVWPKLSNIFNTGQMRDILSSSNVFIVSSPTIFLELSRQMHNTGGVLYDKYSKQIFHIFDDMTHQEAIDAIQTAPQSFSFFQTNQILTLTMCPAGFNFCISGIDKSIGIFDMSLWQWLSGMLLGALMGVSLIFQWIFIHSKRRSMKYRLKLALKHQQFYSLYQPKIQLKTGKIIGVEALARWQDKELGQVPADQFIACAEKNALITPLTRQLFSQNLMEMQHILRAKPDFTLSINLSIQDLTDQSFLLFVEKQVKQHKIKPEQITFEVTERSAAQSDTLKQATKRFIRKGYQISLDDFGTGFSNLSWLTAFKPNEVKIDRMFIQSIGTQTVNQITLKSIFHLVSNLDVTLVFEGIESIEEVNYLLQHTSNAIGQGWLYSKAIEATTLDTLLRNQPFMNNAFLENISNKN
ncbi:EAL domain-containing protein [Marinomonas sp. THO17]|uniref:EAL domain-containing protein n=1 Tax=Marinomonas sp. THO17 TaxID=3149048 RepID=UPI00336C26EB